MNVTNIISNEETSSDFSWRQTVTEQKERKYADAS